MTEMTVTTSQPLSPATARRARRAIGVASTVVVNAALWSAASALGVDFVLSDSMGTAVITLPVAVVATAVFALLGWGALAVLERFAPRPGRRVWVGLAVGVALLSVVPIFLEHATAGTHAALTVLHLAVAAVLVPAVTRSRIRR